MTAGGPAPTTEADVEYPDGEPLECGEDVVARACEVAAVAAAWAFPGVLAGGLAAVAVRAVDLTDWFAAGAALGMAVGVLLETDQLPGFGLPPGREHSCEPSPPDGS